jgi:hypothetical protein
MVIGEKFAWGHIGKTGGDATAIFFSCFEDELRMHIDGSGDPTKHDYFQDRGISDENRILILNIRRLPSLILSQIYHWNQQDSINFVDDVLLNGWKLPNEQVLRTIGDVSIRGYKANFKISRWFRCEYLMDDFADFIIDYVPYSREKIIDKIKSVYTKPYAQYDTDLASYWTLEDIEKMYENNPLWANIEKEVYGNLLVPLSRRDLIRV